MTMRGIQLSELGWKINKKQIIDITDKLPHHPTKVWPVREREQVKRIIIHHFASEAPTVNQAKWHISEHHWPGLAYHFTIEGDQIYQTNDILTRTSHASGANDIGVGVAVRAFFSKSRPITDVERNSLYSMILTLKSLFPNAIIQGHNEASKELADHITACPVIDMNKIREDVAKLNEPTTPELTDVLDATQSAKLAQVYAAYSRFSDLYNVAKAAGPYQEEAFRKIGLISDLMVSAGILVKTEA